MDKDKEGQSETEMQEIKQSQTGPWQQTNMQSDKGRQIKKGKGRKVFCSAGS